VNQQVNATVARVVASLDRAMNAETRRSVRNRWDAMQRECQYLEQKHDARLHYIQAKGWTPQKLGVLYWLNSFYQLLLGPLEAATRTSRLNLGAEVPVLHGTERFDATRRGVTLQAATAFRTLVSELGFSFDWLAKHTARDIIYYIHRDERQRDETLRSFSEQ
jgi:hypothetical protein